MEQPSHSKKRSEKRRINSCIGEQVKTKRRRTGNPKSNCSIIVTSGLPNFECENCSVSFSTQRGLQQHVIKSHQKCNFCNLTFESVEFCNQHFEDVHAYCIID